MAYSIFVIDDINVLPIRPKLHKVIESLSYWPPHAINIALRQLIELNKTANDLGADVEAYSYTGTSNMHWTGLMGHLPNDPKITGVAGTDLIGLNDYQYIWISLMSREDKEFQRHLHNEAAKLVAATSSPKFVEKLEKHEKSIEKDRDKKRQRLVEGIETTEDGYELKIARTTDELSTQLQQQIRGEKDEHDLSIEMHEKRIEDDNRDFEEFVKDRAAQQAKLNKPVIPDGAIKIGEDSFGLTSAQMDEYRRLSDERARFERESLVSPSVIMEAWRQRQRK